MSERQNGKSTAFYLVGWLLVAFGGWGYEPEIGFGPYWDGDTP